MRSFFMLFLKIQIAIKFMFYDFMFCNIKVSQVHSVKKKNKKINVHISYIYNIYTIFMTYLSFYSIKRATLILQIMLYADCTIATINIAQ